MGQVMLDAMLNEAIRENPNVGGILIDPDDLVFEERVKMNCFYCGKFGSNWKCPPRLPDLDYKKLISEFDHAAFIYVRVPFTENNYDEVRASSSVALHHILLECEKHLWEHNNSTSVSFLGGSCRLCKNGCSIEKCNNPYLARAPLEASGINVLKSIKKYGVDVSFPPKEVLYRIGLILW